MLSIGCVIITLAYSSLSFAFMYSMNEIKFNCFDSGCGNGTVACVWCTSASCGLTAAHSIRYFAVTMQNSNSGASNEWR
jgi:hypothetical protein